MTKHRVLPRVAAVSLVGMAGALWLACSDSGPSPLTGPSLEPQFAVVDLQDVQQAIATHERHLAALSRIPGVVGSAVGLLPNGRAVIRVFLDRPGVPGVPPGLDGVPVAPEVTGMFVALSDPTTRQRPAPVGFSIGHPQITAGTIGMRVRNGSGTVFILSNNHVLANSNAASLGDPALQPGPFDGGTVANDQVGTLSAFRAIDFNGGPNTMDAAIALTTTANVGNATPADDGYGTPNSKIWGDANDDGVFDNKGALLNVAVQKYGRTTKRTQGTVTGVNASVTVCYEVFIIFCLRSANFVDQLIITPGTFSAGGDSGSLIVTSDAGLNPVGLLFAGSSAQTIANRIDLVLNHFGVVVDGSASPPPTPVTDVAVTSVTAPGSVTQGNTVDVVVTVQNVGNQNVGSSFDVTLHDVTDNVAIGTQAVAGLAAGASAARTFQWNTTGRSIGSHTLRGSHSLTDDNAANNEKTTAVNVTSPANGTHIHVGDLDGFSSNDGKTWSATVEVTIHDGNHAPINGATVDGVWNPSEPLQSTRCTTGDLGGNGTCIFLYPGIRKKVSSVGFTITSVVMSGRTYQASSNHDPDGSSNGTTITVIKP